MIRIWTAALLLLLLLGTIGCDQATKRWAHASLAQSAARSYLGNTFTLEYAENPGAFLSLGADWPPRARFVLFTSGAALLLVFGTVALMRHSASLVPIVGLILFLGGGMSNLVDRFTRGTVIDFMNVGFGPLRTGIFNVADVAIMVGAAVAMFSWSRR
jgi:signal peptidase II